MSASWVVGPGAVAAGGNINGPVTVISGGIDDLVAGAVPSPARMEKLARSLDLQRFIGRQSLIGAIDDAVTRPGHGYVVIQGEAGVGKTALAAHLVWNAPCAYHFTRLPGGRSPEKARRSLAAQLILGWGLRDQLLAPGGRFPSGCDDPEWLIDVLDAVAAHRDRHSESVGSVPPAVLVVDGLDEAEMAARGRDTGIPLGLPRPDDLPDGVFLVVTSRLGTRLSGIRALETVWRTIEVGGEDNFADMRRYLTDAVKGKSTDESLLQAVAAHSVDPDWFVDTLADRSGGLWIYLRYVIDDIRAGRRSPADLASLPPSLEYYYLDQIERWQERTSDWHTIGHPLLVTLAALDLSVTAEELLQYSGLSDSDEAQAWLTGRLRPFLDTTIEGNATHYAVRHQSLRDLYNSATSLLDGGDGDERARYTRAELARGLTRAHRRIAEHLFAQLKSDPRTALEMDFAREHLPHHAAEAGYLDEVLADPSVLLACNPDALLRQRPKATRGHAHAALSAYELSLDSRTPHYELSLDSRTPHYELSLYSRTTHPDAARWWLHVWARKTRADTLAERCLPSDSTSIRWASWTGQPHRRLTGHRRRMVSVCALPQANGSHLLASASADGTVRLWEPRSTDAFSQSLTGHDGWVTAVCALPRPDGSYLLVSAGNDRTVRLWDPGNNRPVRSPLTGHDDRVTAVCALPQAEDGKYLLASASVDGTVRLWDSDTGHLFGQPISGHHGGVYSICALPRPDGSHLLASAGEDRSVRLWHANGEPFNCPLTGHRNRVLSLCALPQADGNHLLASASTDGTVRLWDPETGLLKERLSGLRSRLFAVCALPQADGNHLLAVAGEDRRVRLWDPDTCQLLGEFVSLPPIGQALFSQRGPFRPQDEVYTVCALPLPGDTYLLVSAGEDRTVRLWDPDIVQPCGPTLTSHDDQVTAVCALAQPDHGRHLLASGSFDGTVRLWDDTGHPFRDPLIGHRGNVSAVCEVPRADGRHLLASAGADGTVRLWDPDTGAPFRSPMVGHDGPVTALCALPRLDGNGSLLASGGVDGTVRLWDDTGHSFKEPLIGHRGEVWSVCALPQPDGSSHLLASGGRDGAVRLWDHNAGECVRQLTGHWGDNVYVVCPMPRSDGSHLLASVDMLGTIRLWDPDSDESVGPPTGPSDFIRVYAMCALPRSDGSYLLASADDEGTVRLWDPDTGKLVGRPLTGHHGWVYAVCTLPRSDGGHLLVSAGEDRTILVWQPPWSVVM